MMNLSKYTDHELSEIADLLHDFGHEDDEREIRRELKRREDRPDEEFIEPIDKLIEKAESKGYTLYIAIPDYDNGGYIYADLTDYEIKYRLR